MKSRLFILAMTLMSFATGSLNAQMRAQVTVGDYAKCIENCKSLTNSEERKVCMEGCRYISGFSFVNVRAFSNAIKPEPPKTPLKDGDNLYYEDKKAGYQVIALSVMGGIADYEVRDMEGNTVPSTLVTLQKAVKKCYVIRPDGTWVEVKCPDVIIIVHNNTRSM